jgi:hypothetical protein
MSAPLLSSTWLASWTGRVSRTLAAMTADFERRHGFPPGTNEIRPASCSDQAAARALARAGRIPARRRLGEHLAVALATVLSLPNSELLAAGCRVLGGRSSLAIHIL